VVRAHVKKSFQFSSTKMVFYLPFLAHSFISPSCPLSRAVVVTADLASGTVSGSVTLIGALVSSVSVANMASTGAMSLTVLVVQHWLGATSRAACGRGALSLK
jgi:hypothetical protein